MDEDMNLGAEVQEVADPVETVTADVESEDSGAATATTEVSETKEPDKKALSDAAFAAMRREAEAAKSEKARLEKQLERLANTYKGFGINGQTPDDVADAAEAYKTGKPVDEIKAARLAEQQKAEEVNNLKREVDGYRTLAARRQMEDDLKAIQKIDPNIKNITDLGTDFLKFIKNGLSGVEAFEIMQARKAREERKSPPEIGKIKATAKAESEFYSNKELDALTSKELDDPVIYEKARKSMLKLSQK